MLARSNTLAHPSGQRVQTPLLIPSFSSKGLGRNNKGVSEVSEVMQVAEQFLTDSMLLSAYDTHHGHLSVPASALTDICFVDSGGYETSDLQDLSATYIHKVEKEDWDEATLFSVLDAWPSYLDSVFVTYDDANDPKGLDEQIERARRMVARYRQQLVAFLVKPETKDQRFVQIKDLIKRIGDLAGIPILGITEKELGTSFIERMERIAKLRLALDAEGMNAVPIHIFGSLDPMSVCLYFISGAEIFDGLTWIRYGYYDGMASYLHNVAVRQRLIHRSDGFAKADALRRNLDALAQLTIQMKKCRLDDDLRYLDPSDTWLREAYDQLRTRVKGV